MQLIALSVISCIKLLSTSSNPNVIPVEVAMHRHECATNEVLQEDASQMLPLSEVQYMKGCVSAICSFL